MKSALVLALAGSAVAAPSFGDFLDALFGGGNNNNNNDNDSRPRPTDFPGLPPFGTGSGVPFPFPTATGQPFPTGTDGVQPFPYPSSESQAKRQDKPLYVDYQLAAKAAPVVKKRELKYRQLDGSALPSFSLLNPSDTPTATEPATDLPTELPTELPSDIPGLPTELPSGIPTDLPGLPTGFPSAPFPFPTGFPGGEAPTGDSPFPTNAPFPTAPAGTGAPGFPGLPTTLGTVTRGPRPTAAPEQDAGEEEETENGNGWLSWISDLLAGGKGGN